MGPVAVRRVAAARGNPVAGIAGPRATNESCWRQQLYRQKSVELRILVPGAGLRGSSCAFRHCRNSSAGGINVVNSVGMWGVGALALVGVAAIAADPVDALTMRECSAKYRAAQGAGKAGGMSWQDFRKANCGPSAAYAPAETTKAAPAAPVAGKAIFPTAISPKYTKESAGRARMHTCLDQYNANKASNGNAGLRWIAKGGGYYSECNKRLKG